MASVIDAVSSIQRAIHRAREDLQLGRPDDALSCLLMAKRSLQRATEEVRALLAAPAEEERP